MLVHEYNLLVREYAIAQRRVVYAVAIALCTSISIVRQQIIMLDLSSTYIDPARVCWLLQIIVRQQPSCSRSHGCVRPAGRTGRRPATWIRPAPHGHACMCIQFSSHSSHLSRATAHRPAGQQRRRRWQKASGGRRQAQAAAAYV